MKTYEREIGVLTSRLKEMENKLHNANANMRTMHNVIQELRGNVRVFARIRPLLNSGPDSDSSGGTAMSTCLFPQGDGLSVRIVKMDESEVGHSFSFDKVFGPEATQSEVFTEVSELVQSALDGHSVCIFSYGQTGSGKTHTMQVRLLHVGKTNGRRCVDSLM